MQTDSNHIIRAFFAAFNEHDVRAIAELFAADAVYTDLPNGKTFKGKDDIVAFLAQYMGPGLGFRWDLDAIHGSGDRVASESFFSGILPPGSAGNPGVTNLHFRIKALTTFVLRDDLLADVTDYYNSPGK